MLQEATSEKAPNMFWTPNTSITVQNKACENLLQFIISNVKYQRNTSLPTWILWQGFTPEVLLVSD